MWEKACNPVGQVQGMPLELPQAVPMGASGCWGHCLTAGAQLQVLLPQGLGKGGKMSHGLVFPEPGSATVWHESLTPWQNSARCTWHHPAQTLFKWGLVWLDPVLKQREENSLHRGFST